jgi:hypothetical protein
VNSPQSRFGRLTVKLAAVVLVVSIVVVYKCSDQALFAALAALLVMGGEAAINDVLPWLNGDEGGRGNS